MDKEQGDLLSILEQKKEWLTKMLDITRQFKVMLEADRIDEFEDGLKNREIMIAKIDGLTNIERKISTKSGADTVIIKKQTQEIIKEILKVDKENTELATKKIKWYKEQIKSINDRKKGMGSYSQDQRGDAFYVDAKK
ncbi:MAG: hypothetical protein WDA65_04220 [Christensenellales bacterium]